MATLTALTVSLAGELATAAPHDQATAHGEATTVARPLALLEHRRVLSYPVEQVWPTTIRYLRIDRGYAITDRDAESGYILFEFDLEGGRRGGGSIEMFATEDASGRPSVSVAIKTGAGPIHLPTTLLDGIAGKLLAERGQPIAPPPADPPDPPQTPDQDEPPDGSVPLLPPASDPSRSSDTQQP